MNIESTPVAPKDQDSTVRAIGNLGIAQALAPPSETSEAAPAEKDFDKATKEKINAQNTKRLKKRFGESFVEDNSGHNARSLAFFDQPDFAEQLKTIIPNKHEALQTLRDNFDYINTQLTEHYKEDRAEKEVPKDPYELAKRVGFELTGPFTDVKDFEQYKKDYRSGERICTYNDPESRLRAYHILWLRHQNADKIPPADTLTQDGLTDEWKQYLRENHRHDSNTDTYDLTNLKPESEDPYGTSSMSVQISRNGTHVSIKNRYNHSVTSPDHTLNNNLDKLVDGLRLAVCHQVGREDLAKGDIKVEMHPYYIRDNGGGLHRYYSEKDNVYYGWYEKIENGKVTTLPENEYYMLSPELYTNKKGSEIVWFNPNNQTHGNPEIERTDSSITIRLLEHSKLRFLGKRSKPTAAYELVFDPDSKKALSLSLLITEGAKARSIMSNPALTSINLAEGAEAGDIYRNDNLISINLAEGAEVEDIYRNDNLTSISLNKGVKGGRIMDNPTLTSINLAEGAKVGDIARNNALSSISLAEGAEVEGVYRNDALASISLVEGVKTEGIRYNQVLTSISLAKEAEAGIISNNPTLTSINLAEGAKVGDIARNNALSSISLAEGAIIGETTDNNPQLVINRKGKE